MAALTSPRGHPGGYERERGRGGAAGNQVPHSRTVCKCSSTRSTRKSQTPCPKTLTQVWTGRSIGLATRQDAQFRAMLPNRICFLSLCVRVCVCVCAREAMCTCESLRAATARDMNSGTQQHIRTDPQRTTSRLKYGITQPGVPLETSDSR